MSSSFVACIQELVHATTRAYLPKLRRRLFSQASEARGVARTEKKGETEKGIKGKERMYGGKKGIKGRKKSSCTWDIDTMASRGPPGGSREHRRPYLVKSMRSILGPLGPVKNIVCQILEMVLR